MAETDLRRLSALLDEVLDLPEAERADWLAGRRDLTDELRQQLTRLISEADGHYTLPPLPSYDHLDAAEIAMPQGTQIGAYVLLRELGHGGMGSVWLAERGDGSLKRQVALKLPHSTLRQRRLIERFARERDILAALEHPNIARLYETGITADGRPWLAMEYVAGRNIVDHCQSARLDLPARLKLFLQVVRAVQYAHSRLIVHRDLKPNNILVTSDGQLRLLDFGIAKLLQTEDEDREASKLTEIGGTALTPQYAAPEQILGQPVGTGVDIYALGLILYELVVGAPPYRLKRDTRGALEDAILQAEPPSPSQAARGTMPWARQLKGDLDAILSRTLKKTPEERYATAAALAEDIERHLAGEPVRTRTDSISYRARKFIRRHRWGVAAAAGILVALMTGLTAALWQAREAQRQAEIARKEARTAQAVKDFLQGIFLANSAQQPDPLKARQTTARELLDIGAAKIDRALEDVPEAKLEMLPMFAELYTQLLLPERAAQIAERHLALVKQVVGGQSLAAVEALMGFAMIQRGRWIDDPHQATALAEANAILDRLGGDNARYRGVALSLQAEYLADHDFPRALTLARQAIATYHGVGSFNTIATRVARIELAAGNTRAATTVAAEGLAAGRALDAEKTGGKAGGYLHEPGLLELQGRAALLAGNTTEAEARLREALEKATRTFSDDDPDLSRLQARLAWVLWQAGQQREANQLLDQAAAKLAADRPGDRSKYRHEALAALGHAQSHTGRYADARTTLTRALAMRDPTLTASPAVADLLRDLAHAQAGLGQGAAAAATLARAIAMRKQAGLAAEEA